jgi:predicted Fe-Mo cluster-binding NifX family protein
MPYIHGKGATMKIAVPVKDKNLQFFGNAGHTPYFAVFTLKGSGMFRSFELEEVRGNPRTDLDDHEEEGHHCSHDENDEAHVREHLKMGDALDDCDYMVVRRACKNTAKAMAEHGIKIKKYNGKGIEAKQVLQELSAEFV